MCNFDTLFKRQSENTENMVQLWRLGKDKKSITSQLQNDYVGLEVGAKIEAIHFLGFEIWDGLSVNGASCDVEYFDPLIFHQETFGSCDSPIEGWSATNGPDYEIVY